MAKKEISDFSADEDDSTIIPDSLQKLTHTLNSLFVHFRKMLFENMVT